MISILISSGHRQQSDSGGSSYCSTHTFSLACSVVEPSRRIHAIHNQLEPQAMPPAAVIGLMSSDVQREIQRKETQETGQQVEVT